MSCVSIHRIEFGVHKMVVSHSWWSGGHSDSMVSILQCIEMTNRIRCNVTSLLPCLLFQDPDSFKEAKLSSHGSEQDIDDEDGKNGDSQDEDEVPKEWDYIRVDGLGFIPGLCCPHHDRIQSNGILRANDFDEMLLRHPTEVSQIV